MAVYAVVNIRITDPDRYAEYIEQAPPTIAMVASTSLAAARSRCWKVSGLPNA